MKSICSKAIQKSRRFFPCAVFLILISFIMAGCNDYLIELEECVTNIEVAYTVEHYQQTVDAKTYKKITDDIESLKGMSLSKTEAKAKEYEGFTSKTIEQQTIKRDGSTVVKIYYDRNNITYTFTADGGDWNGSTADVVVTGRFGASVPALVEGPQKTGYTFASWNQTVPQVFGSQDTTFTAKWAAGSGTLYKVEHLLQDTTGTSYVVLAEDEQSFTGTTGEQTTAQAKEYPGFTANEVTQQSIAADGSTVVNISYDRNTITYTFNADGGNWNGSTADVVVTGRYGATVLEPVEGLQKTGYTFAHWNNTVPSTFGTSNLAFTADWSSNTDTVYKVEHWQQNVDDDGYTRITADTQSLTGTTDGQTNASAKTYEGFSAKEFEQSVIAANGSTVVKVYYDRNLITYRFSGGGGKWENNTGIQTVDGRFGTAVNIPAAPALTGYTFTHWDNTVPSTFGASDILFTAGWSANTDTAYKVEHWQQNVDDDGYTIVQADSQNLYGTTGEQTSACTKIYNGFTAKELNQASISADGSTVVKVYYDRNRINYTFNSVDGKFSDDSTSKTVSGRYGAAVSIPASPERTGYTFNEWNNIIPVTFEITDITFTPTWTANTNTVYKVEHWQQNVDNDEYTKVSTDEKQGTTAAQTQAVANIYEGFKSQGVTQQEINAEGNTVVRINYNRNTIKYTFNPNGGNWNGSTANEIRTGRYGAAFSISNPTLTGYSFRSWNNTVPSTFGAENVTFTSNWDPRTDTVYKVEHYKQNVDDDGYTKVSTEERQGTTATQTQATAKNYTGFTAQEFSQTTIAADGNAVVRINYNRNTIKYTFNSGDGKFSDNSTSIEVSGLYGSTVSKPENPTRIGYSFKNWGSTDPTTFGASDATFTSTWNPNTNTKYTVKHCQQNISGNAYILVNTDYCTGTTGEQTSAWPRSYQGFSLKPFSQTDIAADGSTIIWLYYNRKTIKYTFNSGDGKFSDNSTSIEVSGLYGASVTVPSNPGRYGWRFAGWDKAIPATFGATNQTFVAQWTYPISISSSEVFPFICDDIFLDYTIEYVITVCSVSSTGEVIGSAQQTNLIQKASGSTLNEITYTESAYAYVSNLVIRAKNTNLGLNYRGTGTFTNGVLKSISLSITQ